MSQEPKTFQSKAREILQEYICLKKVYKDGQVLDEIIGFEPAIESIVAAVEELVIGEDPVYELGTFNVSQLDTLEKQALCAIAQDELRDEQRQNLRKGQSK